MEPDSAEKSDSQPSPTARAATSTEQLYAAVVSHEATVSRHESRLTSLEAAFARQQQALRDLLARLPPQSSSRALAPAREPRPSPNQPVSEPRLLAPERYDGNPVDCRAFLTQCSFTFELQASTFPTDRSRIAYIITLLTGKALAWATAIWERQGPSCDDYKTFTSEMRLVFDHSVGGRDAANRLFQLRQGSSSVAEYAVLFRTLAAETGWNMEALLAVFWHGLSSSIKDMLAAKDPVSDLESLIDQTIRLDNRLRERRRERQPDGRSSSGTTALAFSPLQWS